jgi:metal-dependent amidase/aminoacylase/carboxypeptidase family protein
MKTTRQTKNRIQRIIIMIYNNPELAMEEEQPQALIYNKMCECK